MTEIKAGTEVAKATTPQASEASSLPERPKAVKAEDLGLEVGEPHKPEEGEAEFKVHVPEAGWVKDRDGRFHEVEDVGLYLQAYPGAKAVKSSEVKQSLVGYAEPKEQAGG